MRKVLHTLVALIGLALPAHSADRDPDSFDHEVCRFHHGRLDCVRWSAGCARGEDSLGGRSSERAPCRKLAPRECTALELLLREAIEELLADRRQSP